MRYDTKTISKACELYNKGVSMRAICKATGISTHTVVYYHCNPKQRKRIVANAYRWMKNNPEKWKATMKKAAKTYKEKHATT